jgi:hypothetical protein
MKTLNIISALLIFSMGCGKSSIDPETKEDSLIGKWVYTEYFYGTGLPAEWHPVVPANQTIEFKAGGSFVSANSFLKEATGYEFVDSVTIRFQPASTSSGFVLMRYEINPTTGELYLHQVDPACIEGCSNKFERPIGQIN